MWKLCHYHVSIASGTRKWLQHLEIVPRGWVQAAGVMGYLQETRGTWKGGSRDLLRC